MSTIQTFTRGEYQITSLNDSEFQCYNSLIVHYFQEQRQRALELPPFLYKKGKGRRRKGSENHAVSGDSISSDGEGEGELGDRGRRLVAKGERKRSIGEEVKNEEKNIEVTMMMISVDNVDDDEMIERRRRRRRRGRRRRGEGQR